MADTQLRKEFAEPDLKRIRNLIQGKYGDATKTQVGFSTTKIEHKEGDIWEENGKTWTILNGLKQTYTKQDKLKQLLHFPLSCPNCNKHMKATEWNKKMFFIHNKCFSCVLEYETQLKLEGKFDEYEKNILNANRESTLIDFEKALDDYSTSAVDSFVTEDGVIENWVGGNIDQEFIKSMKDSIKKAKEQKI